MIIQVINKTFEIQIYSLHHNHQILLARGKIENVVCLVVFSMLN